AASTAPAASTAAGGTHRDVGADAARAASRGRAPPDHRAVLPPAGIAEPAAAMARVRARITETRKVRTATRAASTTRVTAVTRRADREDRDRADAAAGGAAGEARVPVAMRPDSRRGRHRRAAAALRTRLRRRRRRAVPGPLAARKTAFPSAGGAVAGATEDTGRHLTCKAWAALVESGFVAGVAQR